MHRLLSLLSNTQYGFTPKLSTISLTTVTNKLWISLTTLRDLLKTFDSVNYEILMQKLAKLKVDSFWFRHRTQTVKINTTLSKTEPIKFRGGGVPQGSILGTILFTIYVNDLTDMVHDCEVVQYVVDDTQFTNTVTTDELPDLITRVETTLTLAMAYFSRNGLMINLN